MEINMDLITPLYQEHLAAGGKMVSYAGYQMPVRYEKGIIAEHIAVRTAAGVFDVSHMGEILITGSTAPDTIQKLTTNDFSGMKDGRMRYTLMTNNEGGVVDDIIIYKFHDEKYMMVVNASNIQKDYNWIVRHLDPGTKAENISEKTALIALQGPLSTQILIELIADVTGVTADAADSAGAGVADVINFTDVNDFSNLLPSKPYSFKEDVKIGDITCLVSSGGYTGEDGYEIYLDNKDAVRLWRLLLAKGEKSGLIPCGLGARDSLRLEASMPLYGHELNENITPWEASLDKFVKLDKGDFIGRETLLDKKGKTTRVRVGLEVIDRGIAREDSVVFAGDKEIGVVTSGTKAPYLDKAIAMAMVDREYMEPGTKIHVDVRGRLLEAVVVKMPFYVKRRRG